MQVFTSQEQFLEFLDNGILKDRTQAEYRKRAQVFRRVRRFSMKMESRERTEKEGGI
jgi:hypothetical protein